MEETEGLSEVMKCYFPQKITIDRIRPHFVKAGHVVSNTLDDCATVTLGTFDVP